MGSKNISFNQLQLRAAALETKTSKIDIGAVFAERNRSYLNEFTLFLAHFNAIPNFIHEININCKRANKWFVEHYNSEIRDFYFDKLYRDGGKSAEYDDIFYFLFEDLIVDL